MYQACRPAHRLPPLLGPWLEFLSEHRLKLHKELQTITAGYPFLKTCTNWHIYYFTAWRVCAWHILIDGCVLIGTLTTVKAKKNLYNENILVKIVF